AGLNLPGGTKLRALLDRYNASVFRPAHSDVETRTAASAMRRELFNALKSGQTPQGHIAPSLKSDGDKNIEYWSNAQALSASLSIPEITDAESRELLRGFDEAFAAGATIEGNDGKKYGWIAHPKDKIGRASCRERVEM